MLLSSFDSFVLTKGAFCTLNFPQAALVCRTTKSHSIDHSSNNRKQLENILLSSCLLRNKIIIYDSGRCKKKQIRLPDLALFKWNSWGSCWCAIFPAASSCARKQVASSCAQRRNWPRRLAGLFWRQTSAFELSGQGLARTKNTKLSTKSQINSEVCKLAWFYANRRKLSALSFSHCATFPYISAGIGFCWRPRPKLNCSVIRIARRPSPALHAHTHTRSARWASSV